MPFTFNFDAIARLHAKEFSAGFFDPESCKTAAAFSVAVAKKLRENGHVVVYDRDLAPGVPRWKAAIDGGFRVLKQTEVAILNSWK